MIKQHYLLGKAATLAMLLGAGTFLAGCPLNVTLPPDITPPPVDSQQEYDDGFDDGFAVDEEYWQGFYDSYDTVDGGPIYYSGDEIPFFDELTYDAGYWDGVWYAYNDGYFVAYDYAFTIGFSEGYDVAFNSNWQAFLAADQHVEWLDGGFTDGYNDGFSEGRVFGAFDYVDFRPFDWLDALLDYRAGTDLEIGGVGTGEFGPVFLYEYGTDPKEFFEKKAAQPKRGDRPNPAIRQGAEKQDVPDLSYRDIPTDVRGELNVAPDRSPRSDRELQLGTTWFERVNEYLGAINGGKAATQSRAIDK